jgi:atlastin
MDPDASSVEVDQSALSIITKNLKASGAKKVAIVSVMGAFRTGKSFLLDLMLRHLRFEARNPDSSDPEPPERGSKEPYPLPSWLQSGGANVEGAGEEKDGFRFKGGMDSCTEGIWVWSEPFVKSINGEPVGLLLMDTQGAWDGEMTKEQSATVFGLTAVLSSKQIYNINMMISEDKVENLTYFMQFAQTAIQKAGADMLSSTSDPHKQQALKAEIDQPFQALDFLCRDWRHFKKDFTVQQCKDQMAEHQAKFLDPAKVKEKTTAEVLNKMFGRIGCFCLPHPGFTIQEEDWTGAVEDIDKDFVRMTDVYVREVFNADLHAKKILGNELTPLTFGLVLEQFVSSFHDAAPAACSFTQAMQESTKLMAREQALKSFQRKMDKEMQSHPRGLEPKEFQKLREKSLEDVQAEFENVTIFGGSDVRMDCWGSIMESLETLTNRYKEDNERALEKALSAFAHITILGVAFFVLDRISDWTCDWWSNTCQQVSRLLLMAYFCIFCYVGVHVYFLYNERGKIAAVAAGAEMWKEMARLMGVYAELFQTVKWAELPTVAKQVITGTAVTNAPQERSPAIKEVKKDK